nr:MULTISPECIES: serine/threonine-protein kinase [Myxococcaceae]
MSEATRERPPDPALAVFAVGEEVAGRYRILSRVARGGMGEVYEALDLELQDTVALKVILPMEAAEADGAVERFRREVQLARRVTHPNVCRIFDVGLSRPRGGGAARPFLTMEFLRGETLDDLLRREGQVSTQDALPLVRQMVAGLSAAHAAGVIHRDLKASNVLLVLEPDGQDALRVVLTDFGLARSLHARDTSSVSRTGDLIGTPAYMAPEQLEGGPITPATDLYALGIVLYELLTGARPFRETSALATAMRRLRQPPPSPRRYVPGLDRRWEHAVLRLLERDPARRFQSGHALLRALEGPAPRRPWLLPAAGALAAGLALVGGGLGVAARRDAAPVPDEPEVYAPAPAAARRAVAVLGFRNLSGRDEAQWLSTALRELLAMELAAAPRLRTVPGEALAPLTPPPGLEPGRVQLQQLHARAGVDLVVSGTYLLLASGAGPDRDAGPLRLDVRVQDAATGETLASLSERGEAGHLLELVASAGERLRRALGEGSTR